MFHFDRSLFASQVQYDFHMMVIMPFYQSLVSPFKKGKLISGMSSGDRYRPFLPFSCGIMHPHTEDSLVYVFLLNNLTRVKTPKITDQNSKCTATRNIFSYQRSRTNHKA